MKLNNLITGLQILQTHYKNPNERHTGAEHDIIYAYKTDTELSMEEVKQLVDLGWFQDEVDVEEDNEFQAKHYDPSCPWAAYI